MVHGVHPSKGVVIEPYMPNRFGHQLDYDQLYVENPNPKFQHGSCYFDVARAWYFNISDCTGTCFQLHVKDAKPGLYLSFCRWYSLVRHLARSDWKIFFMRSMDKDFKKKQFCPNAHHIWGL